MSREGIVAAVANVLEQLLLRGEILQPKAVIRAAAAAVPDASLADIRAALPIVQARGARLVAAARGAGGTRARFTLH